MPKFEGDIASWPAFWHRYLPAVHNNVKLTADAKMAVLTDLVVDPGLSKYLVATNDGKPGRYDEAIRILLERYDRPKQLHHKYIMDLFNLNSFNDDATAIAEAADTVATAVTGLLRSDQATIEHIATSIVTPCMPERMRAEWDARTVDDVGVPSIHKWVDFLRKRVANAPTKASDTVTVKESSTHNNSRQRKQPTKGARVYNNHSEPASKGYNNKQQKAGYVKPQCSLCNAGHHVFQCKQFLEMTVTQRRDHVSGANLCFNCLRTGHVAKECQSSFKCRICKKVHNTLLHLDTGATPTTPVNNVVLTSQIQGALGAAPRPQQKERLLMTSQVYLTKSDGERITARAMEQLFLSYPAELWHSCSFLRQRIM